MGSRGLYNTATDEYLYRNECSTPGIREILFITREQHLRHMWMDITIFSAPLYTFLVTPEQQQQHQEKKSYNLHSAS